MADIDGKHAAFASYPDNSTPRYLALKIFDPNYIRTKVRLQNVPLCCSAWGGSLALCEHRGEEETFDLQHPYRSSHPCPRTRRLQNSAAPLP